MLVEVPMYTHFLRTLLWFFVTVLLILQVDAQPLPDSEAQVLVDIMESFPQFPHLDFPDWKVGNTSRACDPQWTSIFCVTNGSYRHIVRLNLISSGSQFTIPTSMLNLTYLADLRISATILGTIPPLPTTLFLLWLQNNRLAPPPVAVQPFPDFLHDMPNLSNLELSGFNFSGSTDIFGWSLDSPLFQLKMPQCDINCEFGSTQGLPSSLTVLELQNNYLREFPSWIGALTSMQSLKLQSNNLSGPIPDEIGNLRELGILDLSFNQLTGPIPSTINNLQSLSYLSLTQNNLNGRIPVMDDMMRLSYMDLSSNQLTQWNPLKGLPGMEVLFLNNNQLAGSLPDHLNNLQKLTHLHLHVNKLSGPLPILNNLTSLQDLNLAGNNFQGNVKTSLVEAPLLSCNISGNTRIVCPSDFFVCCRCRGYACLCSSNIKSISTISGCQNDGTWNIPGNATNNGTVTLGQGDIVVVGADFVQQPQGVLAVYYDGRVGAISVGGTAQLAGTLVITILSLPPEAYNSTIITAPSISGSFSNVTLQNSKFGCHTVHVTPIYSQTNVSLLFTTSSCTNKAKIIGIAAGVSAGGVIIICVMLALVVVQLKKRGKLTWLYWSKPGEHGRDRLGTVGHGEQLDSLASAQR